MEITFDDLTILLGCNSTGKSSLLRALKFFFEGDALEQDDVYGRTGQGRVVVRLTFDSLAQADRDVFRKYALGDQMILTCSWENGEVKYTGRGLLFNGFDETRGLKGRAKTAAYKALRESRPELDLTRATNIDDVDAAMLTWEMEHPDKCEQADQDAGSLFGYKAVGQSAISSRFKFVFVPGVRDAAEEATERKGSLLERLLSAIAEQRAVANEKLVALEQETQTKYAAVIEESHGPTLRGLAEKLQGHVRRYVPNASITLQPIEAPLRVGAPLVELRGGEAHDLSDLGRQGHGFQRTFIIAALEYLAETSADAQAGDDRPTLFFAIEEPELFQHPPRARHFFNTLRNLASGGQSVQVCYATHSPYFVSPPEYASIRVFRRIPAAVAEMPAGVSVKKADIAAVAASLSEQRKMEITRYLARTMKDAFCEAFFARAALLAEGPTDVAVITQAAKLMGSDLTSLGIACVPVSKSDQPVALAILNSLEVPVYAVFDGDSHASPANLEKTKLENKRILRALSAPVQDFPGTVVNARWACFATDLEGLLKTEISGFDDVATQVRNDFGWTKGKAPEVYAETLERLGLAALPPTFRDIVEKVSALATD